MLLDDDCASHFRDHMLAFLMGASAEQFWEAMTISKINQSEDKPDKPIVSPMRLLIKGYPELAKIALDRCMGTNLANSGSDAKEGVLILGNITIIFILVIPDCC